MNDVFYWYIKVILELRPLLVEILKVDTTWSEPVISGINHPSNSYFKIGLIKRYITISGSNISVWLNVYTGTPYNCFCYFELLRLFLEGIVLMDIYHIHWFLSSQLQYFLLFRSNTSFLWPSFYATLLRWR